MELYALIAVLVFAVQALASAIWNIIKALVYTGLAFIITALWAIIYFIVLRG